MMLSNIKEAKQENSLLKFTTRNINIKTAITISICTVYCITALGRLNQSRDDFVNRKIRVEYCKIP
jgi:hypothetical protein